MTALKKFARLEACALWRAKADAQRREVVVSIGDATLIISDMQDKALAHWSLAAIERVNPGKRPALYHPAGDSDEMLEFPETEAEMVDAIEKLRRAVARARPHPGRLRWLGMVVSLSVVVALGVFWLPDALVTHATTVVPSVKRQEIGDALISRIERIAGPACANPAGLGSLSKLRARLGTGPISLLPAPSTTSLHLPGGHILIDAALVEDYEEPDVAAGFILAEHVGSLRSDPLRDMLEATGVRSAFQLLTTGKVSDETLDGYAQAILRAPPVSLNADILLPAFAAAQVRSTPYAYAIDVTGESVLPLIEADPMVEVPGAPLMSDADWLRLQVICDG
ncbi:MAG: hypothetical protein AAF636_22690 [Pseudomonadota bacterium]